MSLSLLSRYAVFVGCVLFTLFSLPFWQYEWLWPFTLVTGLLSLLVLLYVLAVGGISLQIARSEGQDLLPYLPAVIAAYHFGYGLGSLRGWYDVLVRGRPDPSFGRLTRGAAHTRG